MIMLSLKEFKEFKLDSFNEILGGKKTYTWREGLMTTYPGQTSCKGEELVTAYGSYEEASNDGCSQLTCIDGAYDCGDEKLLY